MTQPPYADQEIANMKPLLKVKLSADHNWLYKSPISLANGLADEPDDILCTATEFLCPLMLQKLMVLIAFQPGC